METICQPKKIVNIIAEADELISQLNSGRIEDMEETQRTQFEIYANELKKRRMEVQDKTERSKSPDYSSSSEGIYEAIDDIVTAMKALISNLT